MWPSPRGHLTRRRIVAAAAVSCVHQVLAAVLGLLFAVGKPPLKTSIEPAGTILPAGVAPTNFARPLPGATRTTITGAEASVGFPVALPHDPVARRGDLVEVWEVSDLVGVQEASRQVVDLIFDGGRVTIIMQRATYQDPARWFRAELAEIKTGGAVLGKVNGHPAIVVTPRMDFDKSNPALVEFDWHRIDIYVVSASYGSAVLVRIADSDALTGHRPR